MDIIFLSVAILAIILIIVTYLLNYIRKTDNFEKLFSRISQLHPLTTAFTLDQRAGKFRNIKADQYGKVKMYMEDFPVTADGQYLILKDHGTVVEKSDGFSISGMDFVNFKCPVGYESNLCHMKPLCTADDNGKTKPITYNQFNGLGLYRNNFDYTTTQRYMPDGSNNEPIHKRLRVHCIDSLGHYEIESCPQNTLLNKELQCEPYDICNDRLTGFKHNFKIDQHDSILGNDEYYICENNVSIKRRCPDKTVFSLASNGCISKSICYGHGQETIAVDSNTYIQCKNDSGERISCPDGVAMDENNVLSCNIYICSPEVRQFENKHLRYTFSETTCLNNVAQTTTCDSLTSDRIYKYKWVDDFQYRLENWPKEILKDGKCTTPDDSIIYDPIVNLSWSPAMPTRHPFNLKTQQFECDSTKYKYRWDYIAQKLQPSLSEWDEFVYSGAPCQNATATPFKFKEQSFPKDNIYIIKTQPVHLPNYKNISFWPIVNQNIYYHTRCEYTADGLQVTTYSSTSIPLGFLPATDKKFLLLAGYESFTRRRNVQYYFIASGQLELVVMHEPKLETQTIYKYPQNNRVTTKIDDIDAKNFCINMTNFRNTVTIEPVNSENGKKITFDPKSLTLSDDTNKYNLGFSVFSMRQTNTPNHTNFKFKAIDIDFDNEKLPELQF